MSETIRQWSRRLIGVIQSPLFWFFVTLLTFTSLVYFDGTRNVSDLRDIFRSLFNASYALLAGGVVSFLFYFLMVFVPERRRRAIIKRNLTNNYLYLKKNIAHQIFWASVKGGRDDLREALFAGTEAVESLMKVGSFRRLFEGGKEADEGWYAFENQMGPDSLEYREIILNLQIFQKQIDFVLHNYSGVDGRLFDLMKNLEIVLHRIDHTYPDYDGIKPLCSFLWTIFSGWDFAVGYRDYDPIEKMISDM